MRGSYRAQLQTLRELLNKQHTQALAEFGQTEAELVAKGLPEVIIQRHRDTVAQYQTRFSDMQRKLQTIVEAESLPEQNDAVTALNDLMQSQKLKRSHQKVDPNQLPWGTPDASKVRKPAKTVEELKQLTGISPTTENIQVVADTMPAGSVEQLGGPLPQDLAETPDIKITNAIRDLAENQLNSDPLAIYNWVRNNIEYIPSYGSIQGADYTLQHLKGNAFDTASLLIALLRASDIPARYAYGTVQVPVEKVMNWVGGVGVPEAAQQLLGQGGIPNVAIINGGRITHIEMEHVWVEAWVDYFPSRGAKHQVGDSWIPLDASFKQYNFIKGQDLETNVPFDAQGLVDEITQSATIDETQGFVEGLDQAVVEAALTNYQQQIENYINNQNPDATLDEILGIQKVILQEFSQLAAGLPYKLVARTNNYSELPNSLRHKFRYTLGTELYGTEGNRLITFEQSLPELAGKKHALSFKPATQADENLVNSYFPKPDPDTGEIDPNQLPNTLPGYLISLTAEFTQNGEVIQSAVAGTMGAELYETLALWSPAFGWEQAVNHPTAGEYRAIGLDLQGSNIEEVQRLKGSITNIKSVLESGDEAQLTNLSPNKVVGELLFSTIFSYFALNDVLDGIQSKSVDVVNYRMPSYGLFTTNLQTNYWFGLPRNVSFAGLVMDVDRVSSSTASKDNDYEKLVSYIKGTGYRLSAMEHLVPEQMFSTDTGQAYGVSAVKALALASNQGQKIWQIDQSNLKNALTSINVGADIVSEITSAVYTGKVVTVHEAPVEFEGGSNIGYLIIDPHTGAGAYKISSGANGGFLELKDSVNSKVMYAASMGPDLGDYLTKIGWLQSLNDLIDGFFKCLENGSKGYVGLVVGLLVAAIFVALISLVLAELIAGMLVVSTLISASSFGTASAIGAFGISTIIGPAFTSSAINLSCGV